MVVDIVQMQYCVGYGFVVDRVCWVVQGGSGNWQVLDNTAENRRVGRM
jgi:hypothetical protein